jgi:hypothetical protein
VIAETACTADLVTGVFADLLASAPVNGSARLVTAVVMVGASAVGMLAVFPVSVRVWLAVVASVRSFATDELVVSVFSTSVSALVVAVLVADADVASVLVDLLVTLGALALAPSVLDMLALESALLEAVPTSAAGFVAAVDWRLLEAEVAPVESVVALVS